jgi:hypothetical protein
MALCYFKKNPFLLEDQTFVWSETRELLGLVSSNLVSEYMYIGMGMMHVKCPYNPSMFRRVKALCYFKTNIFMVDHTFSNQ